MKKAFRLLMFLLAFQMEVRVRASSVAAESPENCFKSVETCSLRVGASPFHFQQEDIKLHATKESTLVRLSNHQWRLVKGALWVEQGSGLEIETLYGSLKAFQGEYWVLEQPHKMVIRNVSASLKVYLRDGTELNVPEGFEFWIAGLNSDGKSEFGMIEPINVKAHLSVWNSLFRGSKEEFVQAVKHQKENWGDLAEKGGRFYQAVAKRELASIADQARQVELEKQRKAEEIRKRKQLFFDRTFNR